MSGKILSLLLILIIIMFLINGCWDRREPETLAIVIGAGYDYNPETEMHKYIIQIANPLTMKGAGGSGGATEKPPYWTVSARGHTFEDALANIRKKVSRNLDYAHVQVAVISKKYLDKKGLIPIVNDIKRSRQSRPLIILTITEDDVKEVLSANIPIETTTAMGLLTQIEITEKELGISPIITIKKVANELTQPGIETGILAIELLKKKKENKKESQQTDPDSRPAFKISGKYIFRGGKIAGKLDERETRGYMWIDGQINRALLTLKYPGEINNYVSVVVTDASSEFKPFFRDGKPGIKLEVKAEGRIINLTEPVKMLKNKNKKTLSLNRRMAQVIRNDIKLSLSKSQSLKSDIFGFGNAFYRLKYNKWQQIKDNWPEIFATLPVTITVKADIKRTGMINNSIKSR